MQEICFTKFSMRRVDLSSDSSWQCHTYAWNNPQPVNSILSFGNVVTFVKLMSNRNHSVAEINFKKVQKQENKNIKNVKRCRDEMPQNFQTR